MPVVAQQQGEQRCLLELERPLLREGTRVEVSPGVVNFFGGGDARFRCRNQNVRMRSDSVASYQGTVVQFIGKVRYVDSTIEMTADFGTYFRDSEKWEARGNVQLTNLKDGSTLKGPSLDYFRAVPGLKDTTEMFADQRPTITMPVKDSVTGETSEPYVIVGDRIRTRGNDRVYGGGRVTIDRSDFKGRSDSLFLDSGAGSNGALIGAASLKRIASDSFDLVGKRIDLTLEQRELSFVTARDSARLNSGELKLVGDGIGLDVNTRKVEQTLAWGKEVRPYALSTDFEIRGDSLAFDTPEQQLKEIRAFGDAWVGAKPDSGTGDRDWIAGQKVVASFVPRDSAGKPRPALSSVVANGAARALYRLRQAGQSQASITYNKAKEIRITMRVTPDSVNVADVTALGDVEGIHLQPAPARAKPDSIKADSVKAKPDSVKAKVGQREGRAMSPDATRLSGLDPSLLAALAVLVRDSDPVEGLALGDLVRGYRDTLISRQSDFTTESPGFRDSLLEQVQTQVLPRLVEGGWIASDRDGARARVVPTGEWWEEALQDREAAATRILALAFPLSSPEPKAPLATVSGKGSLLECEGLNKAFKRRRVVRDVSIHVAQGEVIGLLGPNGAGKTTTFYLITGLIRPDSGKIRLDGRDITRAPMFRRARAGIGYLAQEPSVFRKLTVEQNVLAILETQGLAREERQHRLEGLLDELSIKHLRKAKAYSLSGGERRRLEITRALVTRPKFMLLDEPFAGVDPIAVHDIQTIVGGLRHRGIGVVITDHNVEQTLEIVDRAYIMFEGSVQASGTVRELVYNDQVADLYLGPTLTARLRARMERTA